MSHVAICLMLKAPRAGQVKTRLAREVGTDLATAIYRSMVEHQVRQIPRGWHIEVHFSPADALKEMREWLLPVIQDSAEFIPQPDGDLGARLQAALLGAFGRGAARVHFVGGDCPELLDGPLLEASAQLGDRDLVVIPAVDGGYVLIGFKAVHPGVFERISWSTPNVLEETKLRASELGLSICLLSAMEDVDDLPSWRRVKKPLSFQPQGNPP